MIGLHLFGCPIFSVQHQPEPTDKPAVSVPQPHRERQGVSKLFIGFDSRQGAPPPTSQAYPPPGAGRRRCDKPPPPFPAHLIEVGLARVAGAITPRGSPGPPIPRPSWQRGSGPAGLAAPLRTATGWRRPSSSCCARP